MVYQEGERVRRDQPALTFGRKTGKNDALYINTSRDDESRQQSITSKQFSEDRSEISQIDLTDNHNFLEINNQAISIPITP